MSLKNWFSGLMKQKRERVGKSSARCSGYGILEDRRLLAGIFFNSGNGDLTVSGAETADVSEARAINATQLRVTLTGFASQTFNQADVNRIVFIGRGGNDTFTNISAIASLQIGGNGNDQLTGGSVADTINGGLGNDILNGGDGGDFIVGNFGNDQVFGGAGNDRLFGSAGTNRIDGNDGDDIIFGGDQVDTINGNDGADQIFALDGDDILNSGSGGVIGTSGVAQADLILGAGGNDRFVGGNGLNVFYGGDGDDIMTGGENAQNRFHGQNGDDSMTGGALSDLLVGGFGNDTFVGRGGVDFLRPGGGDDTINGNHGLDVTSYSGLQSQYRITGSGSTLSIRDLRDIEFPDGTDTVVNMELLRFADGDTAAVAPSLETVTVRPIIVSNTNGSNTATFFGTPDVELQIKNKIDDIYWQAGVDVNWEAPSLWNNTFANQGNGGTRPQGDLTTIVNNGDNAGVGSANSRVVDLYFVNVAAGFGVTSENQANGLAFVDASGITVHIGDALLTFEAGLDVVSRVVAHEIGHNLGLEHVTTSGNLMGDGTNLTQSQINQIIASDISV